MSYANGTQFYNLPQTVGTDKRDWFDTNSAFDAIDAALHSAVTGQATDAEAISTINGKLATDEADIAALQTKGNTHDSQIAALQTTVTTQASQIQDVRQDAEDMITANNEGAAATSTRAYAIGDYFIYNDVLYKATAAIAIGDTIVPNTNCEATNVDTEITQLNSDLSLNNDISVTGDGVKTYAQLLTELFALIDSSKVKKGTLLRIGNNTVYQLCETNSSSYYEYHTVTRSDNAVAIRVAVVTNNVALSNYEVMYINHSGTVTYSESASSVVTSGLVIGIVY